MAATSSQHVQSIQLKEELDEDFLSEDAVAFDGHYSTRRELESRVSVGETNTYTRPQLRSNGPVMADDYSGVCHVEAWINQVLLGDIVEASQLQHQGEGELDITTLAKDIDEYIEMVDLSWRSSTDSMAIGYGMDDFLSVDAVAFDGHYSTRRELESSVSGGETNTYTRPQLRSNGPVMADDYSGVCHVEAWIDQEQFGDVVEASQLQQQGEGELDITTLGKDVDEYIEMVDLSWRSATDSMAIGYGMDDFLREDAVAFDGHYSTRRELESSVSVGETNTYTRPQLRSNGPVMADDYSGVCHLEAWIDQVLFGDVVEASQLQQQGEGELDITTLAKDIDEYIEMVDFSLRSATDSLAIGYGMDDFEQYYIEQPQSMDDIFSLPVEPEQSGMYYDEPQLWCFST